MGFRFAKPDTTKLDLGDGDWIEVRNELSVAEARELQDKSFEATQEFGDSDEKVKPKISINWSVFSLHRARAYITKWNAMDEDGKPVSVSLDSLGALDEETMQRIEQVITDHIDSVVKKTKRVPGSKKRKRISA